MAKDDDWAKQAHMLWKDFWRNPEVKEIMTGPEYEAMVASEMLTTGDHLVLPLAAGKLQAIESEQITPPTGKTGDGVAKNKQGKPTAYYVAPWGAGARGGSLIRGKGAWKRASDVFFVSKPLRPSGVRGVPPLQAAFPMLHRIHDVCDAEAIAWQLQSRLGLAVNQEGGAMAGYQTSRADETKDGEDTDGDLTTRLTELDYALIWYGNPGETVKGIERNIPGKDFPQSLRAFLRLMGLPLGLPLELILLDWSGASFSTSRAILEQAYSRFRMWQSLIRDKFHRRIYMWMIDRAIAEGTLADREDKYAHDWILPTYPWIEALKEAQAYGVQVERGFQTHSDVVKSRGDDRDRVVAIRQKEVSEAITVAGEIEKEHGLPPGTVDYRQFCGLRPLNNNPGRPAGAAPAAGPEKTPDETE